MHNNNAKEDEEYLDFDEENEEKKDQSAKTENVKAGYV
jgi:hypothetical protein